MPDADLPAKRIHVDLAPPVGTRDAEVERLRTLAAIEVADLRDENGGGWVTFADPEGNAFYVLRSAAERGER